MPFHAFLICFLKCKNIIHTLNSNIFNEVRLLPVNIITGGQKCKQGQQASKVDNFFVENQGQNPLYSVKNTG